VELIEQFINSNTFFAVKKMSLAKIHYSIWDRLNEDIWNVTIGPVYWQTILRVKDEIN